MKARLPEGLGENRVFRWAWQLTGRYFQHDVGRDSAALAYYLLFSIFPFVIFISSLLGLLQLDIAEILRALSEVMPTEAVELIGVYLEYVSSTSSSKMLWFGLVFSIYFPMRATNCLMRSVRKAYHLPPPPRPVVYQVKTLVYTLLLIVIIPLTLLLAAVGERLLRFLSQLVHLPGLFVELWTALRFPALGLVAFAALGVLYAFAQDGRQPVKNLAPGTVFSLALWLCLSLGFSFYVENLASYSVIYGSVGTVIVLILWLYMSATTLILGAECNGVLIALRREKLSGKTAPANEKG